MTKSFIPLSLVLAGSVSLFGACSSSSPDPGSGQPNNGNTGGSSNPTAGNTSTTAGTTGNPNPSGGTGSVGGAGNTGGTAVATAGSTASGGTSQSTGGTTQATGGTGNVDPNAAPAGYYITKEWHGCSWTGKGDLGATTVTPMDFTQKPKTEPFCIKGVVGAEPAYKSVALLGFNVNEPTSASCVYKAADPNGPGAASVTPMADGIAVNFIKQGTSTAFTLRVQIQGPNGHKPDPEGAADRWCATITDVNGKVFVPYSSFTPSCWAETAAARGTPYAKQPISAVVFTVPGAKTDTPYDFCINGFAYGTTAADAPDGPAVAGDQKGTVGTNVSPDGDFSRAKVSVDGHSYIIQNNNWGNPSGTDLILNYVNNSFTIASGSGSGQSAPASFPSIYIGNNGDTKNGVLSTKPGDGLPAQVSTIKSLPSTFRYKGSTGSFNAAYDIWFAKTAPMARYNDGIDGFIMVWLRDPGPDLPRPIGTVQESNVTIAGQQWNVWVGPRGQGPDGTSSNAPVVSFVNTKENDDSRAQTFKDVDLTEFFKASVKYGITADMYLTDVFAGFEIWQGGSGGGLTLEEFKAVVNK